MDTIERNVALLLSGKDAEEAQDFCDFTLEDQNEAAGKFYLNIFINVLLNLNWLFIVCSF